MYDRIETIGSSRVQHGKYNDRVYLMHLAEEDGATLLPQIDALAAEHHYSKIFAKVQEHFADAFLAAGYRKEAEVPRFFDGKITALFMCKYFDKARAEDEAAGVIKENLTTAMDKYRAEPDDAAALPEGFIWRPAVIADADAICAVYRKVFETYPFPIHEPEYIRHTMENDVVYFCINHAGGLVAVSSAEMAPAEAVVEMTDFATLPVCRGHGLARLLLARMEDAMCQRGIKTAYTIARAMSGPMNSVFAGRGFKFGGTLIKNTQICGKLESMNVWHKPLIG